MRKAGDELLDTTVACGIRLSEGMIQPSVSAEEY
jgi:hypothetical protein